jgi:riboflavin synthase
VFTGIVEERGRVRERTQAGGLVRLTVDCERCLGGLKPADSIAVSGCCQTVVEVDGRGFVVEVMPQTLRLTTLGDLRPGDEVNLERSLRVGDTLGGHLVFGHVDGVGEVTGVFDQDGDRRVTVRVPQGLERYLAPRGSMSLDGVSLTIAGAGPDTFEVALIPTTLRLTIADRYRVGSKVNLEVDVLARYLDRMLETMSPAAARGGEGAAA